MAKYKVIIATIKFWNILNAKKFKERFQRNYDIYIFTKKRELNYRKLKKINPEYIFFPHWSWAIPDKIYNNFQCVVFHMTDLPFGRGGSPLQNLILRRIKETKISALKVVGKLDAGPIYLKRPLLLEGSAEQIYKRASSVIFEEMIPYIIKNSPKHTSQKGEVIIFKRRKPEESKIPDNIDLNGVYDYIRMLDAEGYPLAFLETKNLIFEFKKAEKKSDFVKAEVCIRLKEKK